MDDAGDDTEIVITGVARMWLARVCAGWTRGARVVEMRRVGETECVASHLQRGEFPYFEITHNAQIHVEEAGPAEFIAVGVSVMGRCGVFGIDLRSSERTGVEVRAGGSAHGATHAGAGRFATELSEGLDEIGGLPGPVCVQAAPPR